MGTVDWKEKKNKSQKSQKENRKTLKVIHLTLPLKSVHKGFTHFAYLVQNFLKNFFRKTEKEGNPFHNECLVSAFVEVDVRISNILKNVLY